jgi:hypothetical protein
MERINDSTKANRSGCSNLHESRFNILIFIFQHGGLPVKLKSVSRINTVYSATMIVCFYITTAWVFMDTFIHRHNLEEAMKKVRALMGFILLTWIHLTFR